MSERKYTDEEIINKMSAYIEMSCRMCGFKPLCNELCAIEFIKAALKAALGLIKSQKADIEKLQEVNADLNESLRLAAEANKDLNAEIERLKAEAEFDASEIKRTRIQRDSARTDAIKEFAERLKDKARMPIGTLYGKMVYVEDIDLLVAEMTEGE